jgi:hypothetical protein
MYACTHHHQRKIKKTKECKRLQKQNTKKKEKKRASDASMHRIDAKNCALRHKKKM